MKLSKRAILASAALIVAVALSACSSQSPHSGTTTGADPEKGQPVTVWVKNGAVNPIETAFLKKWSKSSGIPVKIEVQAASSYQQALQIALQTGTGPDVFEASVPALASAGLVAPLQKVVSPSNRKAYGAALVGPKPYMTGQNLWAVPITINTTRLAYNKDVFKAAGLDPNEPPKTLGAVEKDCKAIAASGSGAYCFGLPLAYAGITDWMSDPIYEDTSVKLTARGPFNQATQKFDMSQYEPIVSLYREMVAKNWAYPGASSLDQDTMRSAFAAGKIGMFMSSSPDLGVINGLDKSTADWAVGPVPVPSGTTRVRSVDNQSGGFSISAKSKVPSNAAKVLNALISRDAVEQYTSVGLFPLRSDVDDKFAPKTSQFAGYKPTKDDQLWTVSPITVIQIQGETYTQTVVRLILGTDPIDSTLAKVQDTYNAAYKSGVADGSVNPKDFGGK